MNHSASLGHSADGAGLVSDLEIDGKLFLDCVGGHDTFSGILIPIL